MITSLALALAFVSQDPAPPVDPAAADLNCASLLAISIGMSPNPDVARGMTSGLMYYLGRLQVREPAGDWPARIEAHIRERGTENIFASADLCSTQLAETGQLIPAIGEGVVRATGSAAATPAR